MDQLKERVFALCVRKGWGENGVQNPQHIAMAMTVEMSELLEHFQWLDAPDVKRLLLGGDPERTRLIAEEMADVMIYDLQLARALGIDVSTAITDKLGVVDRRPNGVQHT
ncbi:MAG: nucleotide pyrophosphohydrolase [Clostridiales bacterium]|nr:nucleotide pyrophosphohydrolase [Clostridiales bacterium]